jgi:hypothetical protein
VFTLFNCGLGITQNISIVRLSQIGESTNGVQETSKLGGTELIWRRRMRRSESKKNQQVEEQGGRRRRGRSRC